MMFNDGWSSWVQERDKYLEMANHVEWLQQRGESEEARLVEKAMYDMEAPQRKAWQETVGARGRSYRPGDSR